MKRSKFAVSMLLGLGVFMASAMNMFGEIGATHAVAKPAHAGGGASSSGGGASGSGGTATSGDGGSATSGGSSVKAL